MHFIRPSLSPVQPGRIQLVRGIAAEPCQQNVLLFYLSFERLEVTISIAGTSPSPLYRAGQPLAGRAYTQ